MTGIVVLGSANVDWMLSLPRLPLAGETIAGHDLRTAPGGKGANQAVAAARLGAAVTFIGCVGDDAFGRVALAALRAEGIDVRRVRTVPGSATGVAMVLTDPAGANCIALAAGANAALSPDDIAAAGDDIARAALLVCQLETPLPSVLAAIDAAHAAGVPVLLNPAPAQRLPTGVFEKLRFLVPNEGEAAELTGIAIVDDRSAERAATALLDLGAPTVVITRGERGVLFAEGGLRLHMSAPAVVAVDTTGAGDTFVGAFAAAWIQGHTVPATIDFAQRAAAFSVQGRGAQASMPTRRDIAA